MECKRQNSDLLNGENLIANRYDYSSFHFSQYDGRRPDSFFHVPGAYFQKACQRYLYMMLRCILSIATGFLFVVLYLVVARAVLTYFILNISTYHYLPEVYIGLLLPSRVFSFLSLPGTENRTYFNLVFFLLNVLLYSIPPFVVLTIISRFRKKKPRQIDLPPPPPTFDDQNERGGDNLQLQRRRQHLNCH